jgi:RNA-directed DNA polymerase
MEVPPRGPDPRERARHGTNMSQPTSRQELYDRIRQSSKDEVIVEEMTRLGFWPKGGGLPADPAEEILRQGALERQLRALQTEQARLQNVETLKREARRRRMVESRQRQKETKERRLRDRAERAAAWKVRQAGEILFLGAGVSGGLGQTQGDLERLRRQQLPELCDAPQIAAALGISIGELRFLAFARGASLVSHYAEFTIPKRTGGERRISAPLPRLKRVQRWINEQVLARVPTHPAAHGFLRQRSIVTNARLHVGTPVVVNLDLQDFFPTVTYRRVRGLFRALGYSEAAATIFALICTHPREMATVEIDRQTYHVALAERVLPQGAPTSPAITNLVCRDLDAGLTKIAAALGFSYSRYADDLTFSARRSPADVALGQLLRRVRFLVEKNGFRVHPDKTRVLRRSGRQEVTGIVVNERPAICRATLRRFRATLQQIERDGPEGKHWNGNHNVIAAVAGFAAYVAMVDPQRGAALQARVRPLVARHRLLAPTPPPPTPSPAPPGDTPPGAPVKLDASSGDGPERPKKKWWKIF